MRIALVIATLVPTLVTSSLVADAKPKGKKAKSGASAKGGGSAKAHMGRAATAHKAGKFDVALTELQAAYAIEPQPKLLFAMAQVEQKLERCDDAIANYEKFLATTQDKTKRTVVKQAISACSKKLAVAPVASEPPPTTTPEPSVFRDKKPDDPPPPVIAPTPSSVPEAAPTTPAAEVDDDPLGPGPTTSTSASVSITTSGPKPWYKDVLGDVLVVTGVASGVLSVVMYTRARGDLDAAERSGSLADYEQLVSQAHDRRTYAVVFAGAGAVLLGGGLLRYALRGSGERSDVALAPTSGGGLVTWSGGF